MEPTHPYTVEAVKLGSVAAALDKPLGELANLGPDEVRTIGYIADVVGTGEQGPWHHWQRAVAVAELIRAGANRVSGARRLVA
jgi:hypothetical protein